MSVIIPDTNVIVAACAVANTNVIEAKCDVKHKVSELEISIHHVFHDKSYKLFDRIKKDYPDVKLILLEEVDSERPGALIKAVNDMCPDAVVEYVVKNVMENISKKLEDNEDIDIEINVIKKVCKKIPTAIKWYDDAKRKKPGELKPEIEKKLNV